MAVSRRWSWHGLAVPIGGVAIAHHGASVVGSVDDLAVAILDIVDERRLHRPALVRKNGIGIHKAQNGRLARSEGDRQIIRKISDTQLPCRIVDLLHSDLVRGSDRHEIARLFDAPPHGLGAGVSLVEIDEAFIRQPWALRRAEGRIDDDGRRAESVLQRRLVNDRLECGAGLPKGLGRPVVTRADHVETALHRQHAAGVHFLGHEAPADLGDRAQGITVGAILLDDDDHARA